MLRRLALIGAAFALAAVLVQASPASATDPTIGNPCTSVGGYSTRNDNGNNTWCNGTTYQYPFYIMGSAAAPAQSSCSGYTAGAERWNTTIDNLEVCDGTTWQAIGNTSNTCGSPSGLSSTNVTSATLNTVYTSSAATITFSGCSGALSVSVTGASTAQIGVNGGAWSTSSAIYSGQTLQVRLTASGTANAELTATVTVASSSSTNWTVATGSGGSRIFLTNLAYSADLGDLSGADADCQAEANSAGYSGTWKAVLSDATTSAASRLTIVYLVVNAYDGSTVVTNSAAIRRIGTV